MIYKYNYFLFKNYLNENVKITNTMMDDIDSKQISFDGDPFNFNIKKYSDNYTIELLKENSEFNKKLSDMELFISELNNTIDYDTQILNDIKYILIHKRKNRLMNKLEKLGDPSYIIFQTKDINGKWNRDNIKIYKINKDFSNFYKKLISKTIEIINNNDNYIYISNGNNWILKNIENKNKTFKDIMTNDEIKIVLDDNKTEIKII
jgi:hypothetical protein